MGNITVLLDFEISSSLLTETTILKFLVMHLELDKWLEEEKKLLFSSALYIISYHMHCPRGYLISH